MGSLSVAYYTIAQFRLVYCARRSSRKPRTRGVVGLDGYAPT